MALYYDTAKIIETLGNDSVDLKQLIYNDKSLKSNAGTVFALVSESIKWSEIISEVIEHSNLLELEKKLTPALSLLLVHDLLLAKRGLAISKKHVLFDTISKHKARLFSELTRARIRHGQASIESLRQSLDRTVSAELGNGSLVIPRWIRINSLKAELEGLFPSTSHARASDLKSLRPTVQDSQFNIYVDRHIPNLIAIHPAVDLTSLPIYTKGQIILQDKASCFPAYLLDPNPSSGGRVIDGCAAPGNKTTHLAAILHQKTRPSSLKKDGNAFILEKKVVACERNLERSVVLQSMVRKAGANSIIDVRSKQDFLALKPESDEWKDVCGILLDPSCSGSGIKGRNDDRKIDVKMTLPRRKVEIESLKNEHGRKRKGKDVQGDVKKIKIDGSKPVDDEREMDKAEIEEIEEEEQDEDALKERLRALSAFQLKLLLHAFKFPSVERITYSTCSIHNEENENVVCKALLSDIAEQRGWMIMEREDQVKGMKEWERRGDESACKQILTRTRLDDHVEKVAQGCIRCIKGTDEGTMGFFVAGFTKRDNSTKVKPPIERIKEDDGEKDEEWNGFDE